MRPASDQTCSQRNCGCEHYARGLCQVHYWKKYRAAQGKVELAFAGSGGGQREKDEDPLWRSGTNRDHCETEEDHPEVLRNNNCIRCKVFVPVGVMCDGCLERL